MPRAGLSLDQRTQEMAENDSMITVPVGKFIYSTWRAQERVKYMALPTATSCPVLVNERLTHKGLKFREIKFTISEQESGRARTET